MIFLIIGEGFHGCDDELLQLIDKFKNDNGCGYDDDDIEMVLHLRAIVGVVIDYYRRISNSSYKLATLILFQYHFIKLSIIIL